MRLDQGLQRRLPRLTGNSEPHDELQVCFASPGGSDNENDERKLTALSYTGEAERSVQESRSAPFPQRRPAERGSDGEDEDSEDEDDGDDDGEDDGEEKPPVYHHQIWRQLLRKGSMGGLLSYGLFLVDFFERLS